MSKRLERNVIVVGLSVPGLDLAIDGSAEREPADDGPGGRVVDLASTLAVVPRTGGHVALERSVLAYLDEWDVI